MGSHAGLKKVVKTVRGKKGTVRRSYWMKSASMDGVKAGAKRVGSFLNKHKGKIAGVAALAGAAYLTNKYGRGAAAGLHQAVKTMRNQSTSKPLGARLKAAAGMGITAGAVNHKPGLLTDAAHRGVESAKGLHADASRALNRGGKALKAGWGMSGAASQASRIFRGRRQIRKQAS